MYGTTNPALNVIDMEYHEILWRRVPGVQGSLLYCCYLILQEFKNFLIDIMPITLDTGKTMELRACPLWLTLSNMQAVPTETPKVALAAQH